MHPIQRFGEPTGLVGLNGERRIQKKAPNDGNQQSPSRETKPTHEVQNGAVLGRKPHALAILPLHSTPDLGTAGPDHRQSDDAKQPFSKRLLEQPACETGLAAGPATGTCSDREPRRQKRKSCIREPRSQVSQPDHIALEVLIVMIRVENGLGKPPKNVAEQA